MDGACPPEGADRGGGACGRPCPAAIAVLTISSRAAPLACISRGTGTLRDCWMWDSTPYQSSPLLTTCSGNSGTMKPVGGALYMWPMTGEPARSSASFWFFSSQGTKSWFNLFGLPSGAPIVVALCVSSGLKRKVAVCDVELSPAGADRSCCAVVRQRVLAHSQSCPQCSACHTPSFRWFEAVQPLLVLLYSHCPRILSRCPLFLLVLILQYILNHPNCYWLVWLAQMGQLPRLDHQRPFPTLNHNVV